MAINRYFPMSRTMTLRDAMDSMVEQMMGRSGRSFSSGSVVPIDMYEKQDELIVSAALPGADPNDVDVSINQETLTIKATIHSEAEKQESDNDTWYAHEIDHGQFTRTLSLPFPVSADKAEATFENGLLHLKLPKSEQAKPRKVQVQGGNQRKQLDVGSDRSQQGNSKGNQQGNYQSSGQGSR